MRALALCTASLLVACSSVPDVVFADDDAGVDARDSASGRPYDCPNRPPPEDEGVCCGSRLCLGCSSSDCQYCTGAVNCQAVAPPNGVCCRTNGPGPFPVTCQAPSACR